MSIVISICRSEEPFEAAELEHAAAARPGLSFATDRLILLRPNTDPITLNITPNEIWTDDPRSRTDDELNFLSDLAKDLRAEVYCEGEPLTVDSAPAQHSAATWAKTIVLVLVALLATPFLVLWAIIMLPWTLWKIKRGPK